MVLRPIGAEAIPPPGCVPVWDAILPTQKTCAPEYWLITQADHAALSGAIAAALGPPLLSRLTPEVVEGITHHDDGWAALDAQITPSNGRPLSFLDFLPKDFLRAWNGSIERAEKIAPIAGAIVSGHFCRLGRSRLDSAIDSAEDRALLVDFLEDEQARQQRLLGGRSGEEFELLTDVLQFCDVLSLYLCCGTTGDVEFRQSLGTKPIRLRREAARSPEQAAVCRFEPSPFAEGGVDLAVVARHYPSDRRPGTVTLPFLLW
ncbi:MAG TPA: DUF3891 family protein [Terriglobales bacterium]|nr:DUF3891 family protein [Terriglobales bacterium]